MNERVSDYTASIITAFEKDILMFGFGIKTSDKNIADEVVGRMLSKINEENSLVAESELNNWLRRKRPFTKLSLLDLLDFPEMTERELKIFFTSLYQDNQAISYFAEMVKEDSSIDICFVQDATNILKIQAPSRHISKKTYRCFIQYELNATGMPAILKHYCECANDMKTIGSCSHLAATIYRSPARKVKHLDKSKFHRRIRIKFA